MADILRKAVRNGDTKTIEKELRGVESDTLVRKLTLLGQSDFEVLSHNESRPQFTYAGKRVFPIISAEYIYVENKFSPGYTRYARTPVQGSFDKIFAAINSLRERNGLSQLPLIDRILDSAKVAFANLAFEGHDAPSLFAKAAARGDIFACRRYIEQYRVNPKDCVTNLANNTQDFIFKYAVSSGNLELVKYLRIKHKVDIESQVERFQSTALYVAVFIGSVDIVKYLLAQGANPNIGLTGKSILEVAISKGDPQIVAELLRAKAVITTDIIFAAIVSGNVVIANLLIERGPELVVSNNQILTKAAVLGGNLLILDSLVSIYGADVAATDIGFDDEPRGYDILHLAAEGGSCAVMRYLVESHKLPLKHFVTSENMTNCAEKFAFDKTILEKAVGNNRLKGASKADRVELLEYLFKELKLLPAKDIIRHLIAAAAQEELKLTAYLGSFIHKGDKGLLLYKVAKKGLKILLLAELFQLYSISFAVDQYFDKSFFLAIAEEVKTRSAQRVNLRLMLKSASPELLCNILSFYCVNNYPGIIVLARGLQVDVYAKDRFGNTFLHNVVKRKKFSKYVLPLLSFGLDADIPNNQGDTAINSMGILGYPNDRIRQTLVYQRSFTNSLARAATARIDMKTLPHIIHHVTGNFDMFALLALFNKVFFANNTLGVQLVKLEQILKALPIMQFGIAHQLLTDGSYVKNLVAPQNIAYIDAAINAVVPTSRNLYDDDIYYDDSFLTASYESLTSGYVSDVSDTVSVDSLTPGF